LSRDLVEDVVRWRNLIARALAATEGTVHDCLDRMRSARHDLPEPAPEPVHVAVDGGDKIVEFEGFSVYTLKSYAAAYSPQGAVAYARAAAVGVVIPPTEESSQVTYLREALEALSAARAVAESNAGLLLFDGSLVGAIKWHRPGYGEKGYTLSMALTEATRAIGRLAELGALSALGVDLEGGDCGEGFDCVAKVIKGARERPAAGKLAMLSAAELGGGSLEWVPALEVAEKLYFYKRAIEEAWDRGASVAFIAKRSRSRSLCEGAPRPDIVYAARVLDGPGMIADEALVRRGYVEIVNMPATTRELLPGLLGVPEFYRSRLGLARVYLRASKTAPVLQVDVVFDYKHGDWWREVERAVSRVLAVPQSRGYPLSLAVAHEHAVVSEAEALQAVRGLGLETVPLARGVLRI